VFSLVITTLFSFIIRRFLIIYLGVEVLGINSVIVETLNTLCLAEMGIQSAIIFRLYQPVADGNQKREAEIFALFRKAYRIIGLFILVTGLLFLPFVKDIVNTSLDMGYVYAIYLVQF